MLRKLWIALFVLSLVWAVAYGAMAQASLAPTYDLYTDDERYALGVACHGGELRLWQGIDKQSGILFCEGATKTPTPTVWYTAEPLIGGAMTLTPVVTEPASPRRYYFPFMRLS